MKSRKRLLGEAGSHWTLFLYFFGQGNLYQGKVSKVCSCPIFEKNFLLGFSHDHMYMRFVKIRLFVCLFYFLIASAMYINVVIFFFNKTNCDIKKKKYWKKCRLITIWKEPCCIISLLYFLPLRIILSYYTDCLWRLRYSWTFVHIKHKLVFTSLDARMFASVVQITFCL